MKKFMSALLMVLVVVCLWASALAATVTTTGNVWLRSGPGKGYRKITSMKSGRKLEYLGKTSTDSRGVKWYYVKFKGNKGWVSSRYSKLSGSSSSSSSSKSSSSSSSSSNSTPKPTATPVPEVAETPTAPPVIDDDELILSGSEAVDSEDAEDTATSGADQAAQAVELSTWYLANLEEAATALRLGLYQHDESGDFVNTYSNEVLLIGGDTTVEHFHILGEGYSVYGASVGMDMDAAIQTLTDAGLARTDNILGASFQHYAEANAPVNINGFDSFINLIADASGKVSEISWSVYTGDWTNTEAQQ